MHEQHKIRIYLDENFHPSIARALNELCSSDSTIDVYSTVDEFDAGIKDEVLIPLISKNNGILFTKDRKMASRKAERELLDSMKVSAIFYKTANQKYWEQVESIIKHWPKIIKESQKALKDQGHFYANLQPRSGMTIWE